MSDEHPRKMKEKATGGGVSLDGYVKVQSAPYAYDHGAKAKGNDPKSAPLLRFCHPPYWGVGRSGSISCRTLHMVCG